MVLDLVPIWTVLLALAVFYYVVFDGFDLGVGILYGFAPDEAGRAHRHELRSHRSGTATRHGWCSADLACLPLFRLPSRSSFRRSTFPS